MCDSPHKNETSPREDERARSLNRDEDRRVGTRDGLYNVSGGGGSEVRAQRNSHNLTAKQ